MNGEKTVSVKKGIEVRILETGLMDKSAPFCKQTLENYDRFMANTSLSTEELQIIKKGFNIKPSAVNGSSENQQKKTFFTKFKELLRF